MRNASEEVHTDKKFSLEKNSWNTYYASRWRVSSIHTAFLRTFICPRGAVLCRAEWNAPWRLCWRVFFPERVDNDTDSWAASANAVGAEFQKRKSLRAVQSFPGMFPTSQSRAPRRLCWSVVSRCICSLLKHDIKQKLPFLLLESIYLVDARRTRETKEYSESRLCNPAPRHGTAAAATAAAYT